MAKHKIVDAFQIRSKTVISLDSLQNVDEYRVNKIKVDGKTYPFGLMHNEYLYSVDTLDCLLGKTVEFVEEKV